MQTDDKYITGRFGATSTKLILAASAVTLEPYTTNLGYYLHLDGALFCSIVDKSKLEHLFALMAQRVKL